uniref:Uncharacterized protein n=1 Tax=Knipowitschia caucasica TaxID=637954 RepID=A0AAV2KBJ2_KNICA
MRGDRRSSSFRKDKPVGLSRALSWLNVSTLSRQSKRIFHSQGELHGRHTLSHSHLHTANRDDDDNWVYQPQHRIGEAEEGLWIELFLQSWPVSTRGVCARGELE